jgi:hypothetical protein
MTPRRPNLPALATAAEKTGFGLRKLSAGSRGSMADETEKHVPSWNMTAGAEPRMRIVVSD